MDRRVRHHRRFVSRCGLLGAVALAAISAEQAHATCGDWLAHPASHSMSADDTLTTSSTTRDRQTTEADEAKSVPLPKRCNGPYCRSAPFQPAPTTPASVSFPTDKLALAGHAALSLALQRPFYLDGESVVHPARGFPTRIDHPPRA